MNVQNILYIHTHDSGTYFKPYGYDVPTPNLDAFSKEAVCFDQAYCCSPTCSPSRAALLTGRYPHTNGMIGLGNRGFAIQDYRQHLVQKLNQEGYDTVLCGIQHEYARYKDHEKGASMIGYQHDITTDCGQYCDQDLVLWDKANTQAAVDWIQHKEHQQPFFLSMGFFSTHREYPNFSKQYEELSKKELPDFLLKEDVVREDWAGHLESLSMFDQNFGKIIQALKDNGLYDSTLIIFTTDHGIPYPFAKCTLFDSGIHVALVMRYPGAASNGLHYSGLISHVDVAPTICDLLKLPLDEEYQGISFAPVLDDVEKVLRGSIFAEVNFHTSYEPMRCIRTNRYKLICSYDSYHQVHRSNIDNSPTKEFYEDHHLLDKELAGVSLYDILLDPTESKNLINEEAYQSVYEDMKKQLLLWQVQTQDEEVPLKQSKWKKCWVVNKPTCTDPKSKLEEDFIQ